MPKLPAGAGEVVVIHSHPGGSAAITPRDVLAATGSRIEALEAVTPAGHWQRVVATARSPRMKEMLREWVARLEAARGDAVATRRVRAEWVRWLEAQQRLGYVTLGKGYLS